MDNFNNNLGQYGLFYISLGAILFVRFWGIKYRKKQLIKTIRKTFASGGILKEEDIDEIFQDKNIDNLFLDASSMNMKGGCYWILAFCSVIAMVKATFFESVNFSNLWVISFTFVIAIFEAIDSNKGSVRILEQLNSELRIASDDAVKRIEKVGKEIATEILSTSNLEPFVLFVNRFTSFVNKKREIIVSVDGNIVSYYTNIVIEGTKTIDIGKKNKPKFVSQKYYKSNDVEYWFEDSMSIFCMKQINSGHEIIVRIPFYADIKE